ncbi:MAG: S9 family peptidase [Chthonomonadales bacterium]
MSTSQNVPIIPLEDLFGNPVKASPQISRDGKLLAYLASDEGVLNVWIRTVGEEDDRVLTRDRGRGIRSYLWAHDGERLLYVQDKDGDENWHIYSVRLSDGVVQDLTPYPNVQAQILGLDYRHPNELLAGINLRDERLHDVHRIHLNSGEGVLEMENPGDVIGWVDNNDFKVTAAHAALPDGGYELRILDSASGWKKIASWGPEDEGGPYGYTPDGLGMYLSSSVGSDMQELRILDIASGTETTLASHPLVDLSDVIFHPTGHHIQAVGFNEDYLEWKAIDPDIAQDLIKLQSSGRGELHLVSRDTANENWIVLYVSDTAPAAYYHYLRSTGESTYLFCTRPALESAKLAKMEPLHIPTRDGLLLHCYLTVPVGVEPVNLPVVLNVHGGPWARDSWGYDPEAQWLANRGYACLQVNFRSSTGFGKKFLHAGDREWGAKMHDDLLDALAYVVGKGIADPKRAAIYGGSYGGYAALVGAAFTPDVFACSVDIVGPSNLTTLINSIPPYWEPMRQLFTLRVGNPETEPEFLIERSPLFKADQIVCPLLIAQGANDPRVKQAESEQIVTALRERGKEVDYMLFEDEGHGFARPENRLKFYAHAEKFLATHLN